MAGTKISELPVATLPLTGAETVPVVQTGATKQTALTAMPYVPTGTGAVTTTVQTKLRETVSVKDFGAVGDGVTDDTAAIQAAINTQKRVFFPAGTYKMNSHVTVSGSYFNIYGDGNRTILSGSGRIAAYRAPDTSYPTTSNPGPMTGCGFYFTNVISQSRISDMRVDNFIFAFAFFEPHNSPAFVNLEYRNCNALVFCYQGCQNYYYEGIIGTPGCGPIHISSATCFPSDSPYKNRQNNYTDGFKFKNANGALSGTGTENTYFDAWFLDSILRPTVASSVDGNPNYVYPFASTDPVCKPSGWSLAYVPARNKSVFYGVTIENIDLRFGEKFGAACFNGAIRFGSIDGWNLENQTGTYPSHFTIGSVASLTVSNVYTITEGVPQAPFIRFTGHVFSSGTFQSDNQYVVYLNSAITNPIYQPNFTDTPVSLEIRQSVNNKSSSIQLGRIGRTAPGGSINTSPLNPDSGRFSDQRYTFAGLTQADEVALSSWNYSATYPYSDGTYWHRYDGFRTGYGDTTGLFQISALNLTTGETDYGEFYAQTGNTYTLTTAADINNGDYTITVTANPPRSFSRFSQFTVGGVTVVANSYNSTTKVITLEGPVAGLAATVSSGATMTKTYFIVPVKPFARGFVQMSFGGFPYCQPYDLCIGSLVSSYSTTLTASDEAVYVSGTFTQTVLPNRTVNTAAPTTGKWVRGAIIWNSSPSLGAPPGWVCVTSGTPGTWKAMANLV